MVVEPPRSGTSLTAVIFAPKGCYGCSIRKAAVHDRGREEAHCLVRGGRPDRAEHLDSSVSWLWVP